MIAQGGSTTVDLAQILKFTGGERGALTVVWTCREGSARVLTGPSKNLQIEMADNLLPSHRRLAF